jgi:hypothetical protein
VPRGWQTCRRAFASGSKSGKTSPPLKIYSGRRLCKTFLDRITGLTEILWGRPTRLRSEPALSLSNGAGSCVVARAGIPARRDPYDSVICLTVIPSSAPSFDFAQDSVCGPKTLLYFLISLTCARPHQTGTSITSCSTFSIWKIGGRAETRPPLQVRLFTCSASVSAFSTERCRHRFTWYDQSGTLPCPCACALIFSKNPFGTVPPAGSPIADHFFQVLLQSLAPSFMAYTISALCTRAPAALELLPDPS